MKGVGLYFMSDFSVQGQTVSWGLLTKLSGWPGLSGHARLLTVYEYCRLGVVAVVDTEYSDPTQNFSGLFSLQQQQLSQTKICT